MTAPACAACGRGEGVTIPLARVRALGWWAERTVDERPLCRTCARGPGLRAVVQTGLLGWWGWPGAGRAAGAIVTTVRGLTRVAAMPRALAVVVAGAAFLVPPAAVGLVAGVWWLARDGGAATAAEANRLGVAGAALLAQGDAEGALSRYREALRLTPGVPELCYGAGAAATVAGRRQEAEAWFREAIGQLAPERDARFELGLADLLAADGRPAEALPHLEQGVAMRPTDVQAQRSLQDALLATGSVAKVERRYAEWLRDHPDSADAHYLYARLLHDPPGRAAVLRRGLALDGEHFWCRLLLGEALLELGDGAGAALEFEHAARLRPGNEKAPFGLLRAQLAQDDRAGATTTLAILRRDFPRSAALREAERLLAR